MSDGQGMKTLRQMRLRAEEAELCAARAIGEDERAAYQRIADGWRQLEGMAVSRGGEAIYPTRPGSWRIR
jgi:hypothetical protein